jgi:hypothetical protein
MAEVRASESSFHPVVPELSEPSLRSGGAEDVSSAGVDAAGLPVRTNPSSAAPAHSADYPLPKAEPVSPAARPAPPVPADGGWFSLSGLAIILVVLLIGIAAVGWFFTRSEEAKPRPVMADDLGAFANRAGSEFNALLERRRRERKNRAERPKVESEATPEAPDPVVTADDVAVTVTSDGAETPDASAAAETTPVAAETPPVAAETTPVAAVTPDASVAAPTPVSMAANFDSQQTLASGAGRSASASLYEHVQRETALTIDALDDEIDVPGTDGGIDVPGTILEV